MAHNKCLKYSLFWAATATAPISTCTLDATITSVDSENLPEPESTCINYGYLYNWYVATDARKITSSDDWSVATSANYSDLITYLGGSLVAGHKLREVDLTYWNTIINNTNESGFSARGGGYRNLATGVYSNLKDKGVYLTTTVPFGAYASVLYISDNGSATIEYGVGTVGHKKTGASIRLIYTGAGTPTIYTGNDGKNYSVVQIGSQYWISSNLAETKYRNTDNIPEVTDNVTWAGLVTGARCSYNNNEANAVCSGIIVVPDPEVPENCDIFVPQGFSPSNQDGINDYFRVQNLDCYPIHKMSIYDRNGSLLYTRTNNYDTEPWDGKVGGTIISGVTRTWILEINGAIHSTGSVYVI